MIRKITFAISVILCVTLTSCEEWFDLSPKSELKAEDLFETEQGFRDALIGCYALMAQPELYGAELTFTYMDVLSGYYTTASGSLNAFRYAYEHDYANQSEENRKDGIWKKQYNVISNLNSLLERIDEKEDIFSVGNYGLIKGEALAMRGLVHLDLLRMFAPAPSSCVSTTEPAIPYVDRYTNQLFPRLTVSEVTERVITDLTKARTLLAEVDPYGPRHSEYDLENLTGIREGREFRLNYYATTALLARTLLYRGEPADSIQAYEYATEVIESGLFPLISSADLNSMDQNGFVQENIFALECIGLKEDLIDNYFYVPNTSSQMLAISSTTLGQVFPASLSTDYRKQWWLEESGSYHLVSKYNYSERVPIVKISEMYLIASETAATIELAAEWFNELQYHRGLPDEELAKDNFKERLLQEYTKEFLAEGQLFYAYKRMNMDKAPITNTPLVSPQAVYNLPIPDENTYFAQD